MSAEQLHEMAARLMVQVRHLGAMLDKLTHENALLKRITFAALVKRRLCLRASHGQIHG